MRLLFNQMPFNQPLDNWNTSSVTRMDYMFQANAAFNQDISMWDFRNITLLDGFMSGKNPNTFSKQNYDTLLNSWASQDVKTGLKPNFSTAKYTVAGQAARTSLIQNKGWTITDGGITT